MSGGFPAKKQPSTPLGCSVCEIDVTEQAALDAHLKGAKHDRMLRSRTAIRELQNSGQLPSEAAGVDGFRCQPCGVSLNSHIQLASHVKGAKHKQMTSQGSHNASAGAVQSSPAHGLHLKKNEAETSVASGEKVKEAAPAGDQSDAPKAPGAVQTVDKSSPPRLECRVCGVTANSPDQYKQHMESIKHATTAERRQGKPWPGGWGRGRCLDQVGRSGPVVGGPDLSTTTGLSGPPALGRGVGRATLVAARQNQAQAASSMPVLPPQYGYF